MKTRSFSPLLLASFLCLANCGPWPSHASSAPETSGHLEYSPIMDASGAPERATVGRTFEVPLQMLVDEPAGCGDSFDTGTRCSPAHTSVVRPEVRDAACDDDACEIVRVDVIGAELGAVITVVPKRPSFTLRVTARCGEVSASTALQLTAERVS